MADRSRSIELRRQGAGRAFPRFTLSILFDIFGGPPLGAARTTPQQWGNALALGIIPDPYLASFACALAVLALITPMLWPLRHRGVHFRL